MKIWNRFTAYKREQTTAMKYAVHVYRASKVEAFNDKTVLSLRWIENWGRTDETAQMNREML